MGEIYNVPIGEPEWDFKPNYGEGKITAKLRQLSVEEYDECIDPSKPGNINRRLMVLYGTISLKGLAVDGKPIEDADALLAAPKALMPLFAELWLEIHTKSDVMEQEVKNSSEPSG